MIAAGKFIMTRDEILAVAVCAANNADDPHKAPASQLRRLTLPRPSASSSIQTVRSPRCRRPSLYSDQLVTRYFCFGILSRRAALNLCGIYSILKGTDRLDISAGGIRATAPGASQQAVLLADR